jgi:hypothetical protein
MLSCFDYWYLFPHRIFLVLKLRIDIHGFRLCAVLNDKSVDNFLDFIANFNMFQFI